MSRAKTSHRIRRAKNARTGNQILLRKIGAICGRAAARVTGQRIDRHLQQIRAVHQASRNLMLALHTMGHAAALAVQGIRTMRGAR